MTTRNQWIGAFLIMAVVGTALGFRWWESLLWGLIAGTLVQISEGSDHA